MLRFKGSVVSEGIARGEAFVLSTSAVSVREGRVLAEEVERELARLERGLVQARREIEDLKEMTRARLGDMTEVIDTYLAFLRDEKEILEPIRRLIRDERWNAPSAVNRHFARVIERLRGLPEPLPSRIPDLLDIERRLVGHLIGQKGGARLDRLPRKVVIVADDLSPTQTATLDREKVLGFATDLGGPASHTAILARHLGIPAVVGLGNVSRLVQPGTPVIVDGHSGEVIIDPDPETVRTYLARQQRRSRLGRRLLTGDAPPRTTDGVEIRILANIDVGEGGAELKARGMMGVGLFRTEFLYLGRDEPPDEEDQTKIYAALLAEMAPHPVCLRTMDFGADKFDHRVGAASEPNPFLGMRALRLSFEHEALFRTQLRAILRASPVGRAQLMFPMVADVGEFRKAQAILEDVMAGLEREGVPFDRDIEVGAMIEVPSAAINAEALLREAAFVSVGTNDLTQYTLAVDRTNPLVAHLWKPHHPAVLQLIHRATEAAVAAGKPISTCGEMAGSKRYAPVLVGLGIRTLSMAVSRVAEVVDMLRRVSAEQCREVAVRMMAADDAAAADRILSEFLDARPRRTRRR